MANVIRKITLTSDPGAAGPLYDVYYSTDCTNYTICTDGSSVSLPTVGSTANVTFPDTTTCIKLINLSSGCGNNFVVEQLAFLDYLVVAGGAGGGYRHAGGGGAGGLQSGSLAFTLSTNYTVTIGAGGAGATSLGNQGSNGNNSVFNVVTSTAGGGGGSAGNGLGVDGGSGGGGAAGDNGGNGTSGQGNVGAAGVLGSSATGYAGGGGGGASESGISPTPSGAINAGRGDGGSGSVWLNGIYYGGGGGGGNQGNSTKSPGNGGIGGGGAGGGAYNGTAATVNTGGGGGGGGFIGSTNGIGGAGGSGVVFLRYPSSYTATVSGGLTASTVTTGSYKITTFTAGTGTVSFS
jgi:hypothetical protein